MPDIIENTVQVAMARESVCPIRQHPDVELSCLGDRCMAWRWSPRLMFRNSVECADPNAEIEPPRPAHVPADWIWCPVDGDPACWVEPKEQWYARWRGYCGLAPLNQETRHA